MCENFKMPNYYATNQDRYIDVNGGKNIWHKSDDFNVFMECLLPMTFIGLPKPLWNPIIKLSQFFYKLVLFNIMGE